MKIIVARSIKMTPVTTTSGSKITINESDTKEELMLQAVVTFEMHTVTIF